MHFQNICTDSNVMKVLCPELVKNTVLFLDTDGTWSTWSPWLKSGAPFRVRNCRNPFTNASASDCPGPKNETNQDIKKSEIGLSGYVEMQPTNQSNIYAL